MKISAGGGWFSSWIWQCLACVLGHTRWGVMTSWFCWDHPPSRSTGEGSHLKTCEIWWRRGNEHVWIIHNCRWTSYNPIYSWYNYPFSSPKKDGVALVEVTPWYFPFLWWSAAWWPCPSTSSWRCPASAWAGASNFAMRPAGKLQRRRKRWRHREMGTPGPKYQNQNCSIFVVKDDLIFDPPPPKMYIEVGRQGIFHTFPHPLALKPVFAFFW